MCVAGWLDRCIWYVLSIITYDIFTHGSNFACKGHRLRAGVKRFREKVVEGGRKRPKLLLDVEKKKLEEYVPFQCSFSHFSSPLIFFFSPVRACLLLLCFFLLLLFSVLPLFAPSLLLCPPLFHLPVFTSSQWFARKCFFIETKKESAYTSLAACRGNALVQKQN